jgi:4-hydroxythreonine-4-phosphate dehydrogenase
VRPLRRIAITTGDTDGIGLEVSIKALKRLGPQNASQFILFRSSRAPKYKITQFRRIIVPTLEDALSLQPSQEQLIEVCRTDSPAQWVEEVARACLQMKIDALATGPLSKQEIQRAGFKDIGHTDILKRVSRCKTAFMTFLGPQFNVLLASGHTPLQKVEGSLNAKVLRAALDAAQQTKSLLPPAQRRKPIAVLGLNPHAGDKSLIGRFESCVLSPLLLNSKSIVGPLVPDVAFLPENWKKYSVYVALYHDQGLIPFKMIHGFDAGVHLTMGLPIKRSSVDHGTAKDLYGLNKANPGSMIEAIKWAVRLAHKG